MDKFAMELIIYFTCFFIFIIGMIFFNDIWDFFENIINKIKYFYQNIKIKKTPEYKDAIKFKELTINKKLEKYNSKDIEVCVKYFKLNDMNLKNLIYTMKLNDIEKYLRKKKIQKLK